MDNRVELMKKINHKIEMMCLTNLQINKVVKIFQKNLMIQKMVRILLILKMLLLKRMVLMSLLQILQVKMINDMNNFLIQQIRVKIIKMLSLKILQTMNIILISHFHLIRMIIIVNLKQAIHQTIMVNQNLTQ